MHCTHTTALREGWSGVRQSDNRQYGRLQSPLSHLRLLLAFEESFSFGLDGGISGAAVTEKVPHIFHLGLLRNSTPKKKQRGTRAGGKGSGEIELQMGHERWQKVIIVHRDRPTQCEG